MFGVSTIPSGCDCRADARRALRWILFRTAKEGFIGGLTINKRGEAVSVALHDPTPNPRKDRGMGLILALLGNIASSGGAGVAGVGEDFWGHFYNAYIYYSNFICMWGC